MQRKTSDSLPNWDKGSLLFKAEVWSPCLYPHHLAFNVHPKLCPNSLVIKLTAKVDISIASIKVCDLHTPC
ncbi:hypothetical protein EJD97_011132, partial [Solanum chilense]